MKKLTVVLLALILIISFSGCTVNKIIQNNSSISSPVTENSEPNGTEQPIVNDEIYYEGNVSKYASIVFKNEAGELLLHAGDLSKVYAKRTEGEGYVLELEFTPDGTEKFAKATKENIGKTLSIYIDGELVMSPTIVDEITDGKTVISNGFKSKEELLKLCEALTLPDVLPLPEDTTKFYFSSGAGAWSTDLTLNKNGTFAGYFHDSNMGENGDEYPNGTVYISEFTGRFKNIEKVNDYSYKMTLVNLNTNEAIGKESIEEGTRYIYSEPYGIDGGTEFILYLPNTPIKELPEDFLFWWPLRYEQETNPKETLSRYGILNVATEEGFFY